jgi:hypothetical protein
LKAQRQSMFSGLFGQWGPLLLLTVAMVVVQTAYAMLGVPPSDLAVELAGLALVFFILLWIMADARQRRKVPCFDFGLFLAVAFPVSIVCYVLWTRGFRGLIVLGAFLALYLIPWLGALMVWVALAGLRGVR